MKTPRIYRLACELLEAAADDFRASAASQRKPDDPDLRETAAGAMIESAPNPEPDELHAHHYRSGPPASRQVGFVITTPDDPRTGSALHAQTRPAPQTHKHPHEDC